MRCARPWNPSSHRSLPPQRSPHFPKLPPPGEEVLACAFCHLSWCCGMCCTLTDGRLSPHPSYDPEPTARQPLGSVLLPEFLKLTLHLRRLGVPMHALRTLVVSFVEGTLRVEPSLHQGKRRETHEQPHGDQGRQFPCFGIAGKGGGVHGRGVLPVFYIGARPSASGTWFANSVPLCNRCPIAHKPLS